MELRKEKTIRIQREEKPHFCAKDPGSALTHFLGFCGAVAATPFLLTHAGVHGADRLELVSLSIFMLSMTLLYGASTAYHTLDIGERANKRLKKIDHMMIFVLIAGSYTPFCTLVLRGERGKWLLITVWSIAAAGMLLKACWVTCPKWFSSVIYIAMGWACVSNIPALFHELSWEQFLLLLAGGLIYTAGGVIYAMKFPVFGGRSRYFGSHELFHVFVMMGSVCHFFTLWNYVGTM